MTSLRASDVGSLVACVLVCEGVGLASGLVTARRIPTWYAGLAKPSFNPPSSVFGPVWTLLYLLMGVALFLVLRLGFARSGVGLAVALFALQLALNAAWTLVFFGARSLGGGLAVIVALLVAIAATIAAFLPLSQLAGWLLVPYLGWVAFATVLNAALWRLNR